MSYNIPTLKQFARWWDVDPEDTDTLASTIHAVGMRIENWVAKRRYENMVYARLATGRDLPILMGAWMSRRVGPIANTYTDASWDAPDINIVARVIETLANRIYTSRPWAMIDPKGDFKIRTQAKMLKEAFATLDAELRLFEDIAFPCGIDNLTFGQTFCTVSGDKRTKKITVERTMLDDVLIDEIQASYLHPTWRIRNKYVDRDDYASTFEDPKTGEPYDEGCAEHVEAIMNAKPAFPGVVYAGCDVSDLVIVREAVKLQRPNGEPGRRTVCTEDHVFEDESFPYPFFLDATQRCTTMPIGYWGQGVAEAGKPTQFAINEIQDNITENQRALAGGVIVLNNGVEMSDDEFTNYGGKILRNPGPAGSISFETPPAASPELYRDRDWHIADFYSRWGMTPQDLNNAPQAEGESGVARMLQIQRSDQRHLRLPQGHEQFLTDIRCRIAVVAAELDLVTETSYGPLHWREVDLKPGNEHLTTWAVSSFPFEPAGRQAKLDTMLAQRTIGLQDYMRAAEIPSESQYLNLATAVQDRIDWALDKIVETGKYVEPSINGDLDMQVNTAVSRYEREETKEIPEDRLRLLQRFIDQAKQVRLDQTAMPAPNQQQVQVGAPVNAPAPQAVPFNPNPAGAKALATPGAPVVPGQPNAMGQVH